MFMSQQKYNRKQLHVSSNCRNKNSLIPVIFTERSDPRFEILPGEAPN